MKTEQKEKYDRTSKNKTSYCLGDLVYVCITNLEETKKLKPKWDGPYRIVKILQNNLNYVLKHWYNEKKEVVHHNRMIKGIFFFKTVEIRAYSFRRRNRGNNFTSIHQKTI